MDLREMYNKLECENRKIKKVLKNLIREIDKIKDGSSEEKIKNIVSVLLNLRKSLDCKK